ncbi:MAG: NifU family protein [Nitrospirota bacterium]
MSTVTIPTVTITQTAREQILAAINTEGRTAQGLRLIVKQAGTSNQQYGLSLVEKSTPDVNDVVVEVDGIKVFLERNNTRFVDGATIDYLSGPNGSGFKIESPYKPPVLPGLPGTPPTGPLAEAVIKVINEQINPGVAGHGGHVTLVDVKDDIAYVKLGGGCQGCGMADVTLKQGIVVMIKKAVPTIKDVLDVTDHAGGANPYYQPSSK